MLLSVQCTTVLMNTAQMAEHCICAVLFQLVTQPFRCTYHSETLPHQLHWIFVLKLWCLNILCEIFLFGKVKLDSSLTDFQMGANKLTSYLQLYWCGVLNHSDNCGYILIMTTTYSMLGQVRLLQTVQHNDLYQWFPNCAP